MKILVASNFSSTQEQLVFKLKLIILVKDLCIFLRRGGERGVVGKLY